MKSAIYEGWVRHRRHSPVGHAFRYRMFQLYLDLAELDQVFAGRWLWSVDRPNLAQLRRRDYFGDPALPIDTAVRDHVQSVRGTRPTGPIRLLTHARYFGKTMNPVSFYYGFADDGETLDWVLAEITNTPWNQRHAYLLQVSEAEVRGGALHWGFDKTFHVSPFMPMQRRYRWVFQPPGESLRVHMEVLRGDEREFDATLVMERRPLAGNTLASCLARYPLLTAKVGAAIYWQAARLWFKRTPFHPHPDTLPRSSR
ncbi:DUF1365 domain-containing protein [Arenimonas sp.]|uniref:DUF1365 domain-containing protein n=1 Tax=Arenimonas sp. TaxID=1872635 RepID=UPI0035B3840C